MPAGDLSSGAFRHIFAPLIVAIAWPVGFLIIIRPLNVHSDLVAEHLGTRRFTDLWQREHRLRYGDPTF
jgi:hypothetical protein